MKWSNEEIIWLKNNYNNNLLKPYLFENRLGRNWNTIKSKAHILGLKRIRRQFIVNDSYFDKIDSFDKAYFLGLLYADGSNNLNCFSISLKNEDSYILEIFKQYLEYEGKVRKSKFDTWGKDVKVDRSTLAVYSKSLCQALVVHGCIPNKTNYLCFPQISNELIPHFMRGYFDGDGCITSNKKSNYSFFVIGTLEFLIQYQAYLIEFCGLKLSKLRKHRNELNNIYILNYGGNLQINSIYNFMYKNCKDCYLIRKKLKFEKCKSIQKI